MSKPEVLLIDLSSLYWTSWHVTKDSPISEGASLAAQAVRRAIGQCEPGALVAICTDVGRSFRKDLAPEYKANRPEKDQSALAELDKLKETLAADGLWVVGAPGFEADDVIATLCLNAVEEGHPVCVASADKDLLQLTALADVRQLRTHNNWDTWREANVLEKFGVPPYHLGDWLALVGDTSDNIKGVPSVGATTATKLLNQHKTLGDLYAKIDALQVINGQVETKTPAAAAIATPAIVDKLWRHKADAFLARKLVTLRTDAPVKFDDIFTERKVMTKTNSGNTNLDDAGDIFAREEPKPRPTTGTSAPAATEATAPVPETTTTTSSTDSAPAVAATTTSSTATEPATALVPHVAVEVEYEHALEPRTAQQALTLGEVLYQSRAFTRFPTPGSITATIMRGRELGYSALASLDAWHFVSELGRILPSWQVIVDLAEKSPNCEWFRWVGGDDKSQTWETKHRNHAEPQRLTYTYAQAEKTGLVKPDKPKSAWMARPDEMLRKTAACQLARAVYPGATLGLYAAEEMGDV